MRTIHVLYVLYKILYLKAIYSIKKIMNLSNFFLAYSILIKVVSDLRFLPFSFQIGTRKSLFHLVWLFPSLFFSSPSRSAIHEKSGRFGWWQQREGAPRKKSYTRQKRWAPLMPLTR